MKVLMMKRIFFGVLVALSPYLVAASGSEPDTTILKPKPIYGQEAKIVAYLLDNNHYRKISLDDSLSSAILDQYIKNIDVNKTYFTSADLARFERFRKSIDDMTNAEDVSPAYEIYNLFKQRFEERLAYVFTTLLNQEFDFSVDEYYEMDRDKEPWAKSEEELNEIWRKTLKNQALSLKLAGKTPEEIKKTLKERYDRLVKSMNQFNSEDVFSLYMNTITEAYDPHTNYFSPKAADLFKQSISLSLEGIGARLQTENDYTKVIEVLPGGPAFKSDKIHTNDRIIGVAQGADGEMVDVIGWRVDDVVKLIKGPKGTQVRLQILPSETGISGASVEIVLIRDKIKLEDQQAKKSTVIYHTGGEKDGKDLKLGVIKLPSFYMDFEAYQKGDPNYNSTTRDVQKLIRELQVEKLDGLVLDLRDNGGGSLAEAIDLTGLFIKNGPVVQVKNSTNRIDVGSDDNPEIVYNGPLVVLTNRFSASASEIFAGAIQDYHRGVVVGESTFGKGTVQTIIDLNRYMDTPGQSKAGELKLTFQKFYRITGSSTQHRGVTPDVKLPTALNPEQFGESSSPSALPWDEIKGTLYEKTPVINDRVIAGLNKSYRERLKTDQSLGKFVSETEETRKGLSETKISLNETVRKKEMEESEKRRSANDKLNATINPDEVHITHDLLELNDEYLREGLIVLSDLITTKIG